MAGATFGLAYMYTGKDWVWKPLQQKAIEYSKDGYLFPKSSATGQAVVETPAPARRSNSTAGVVVNTQSSGEEHTAKEYAEARYQKIKSWWDSKRSGGNGNKEP